MLSKEEEIIPESHLKNEWHAASRGRKHFNEIAGMELINFFCCISYLFKQHTRYNLKIKKLSLIYLLITQSFSGIIKC
jgi:hypothetical protein